MRINQSVLSSDSVHYDFGRLDSAVAQPRQSAFGMDAYPDIHHKAAALFRSLVRNHPFLDGNKRTGLVALVVMYLLNGFRLDLEQGEAVALALDVAEGQFSIEDIVSTVKPHVHVLWSDDEEEPSTSP